MNPFAQTAFLNQEHDSKYHFLSLMKCLYLYVFLVFMQFSGTIHEDHYQDLQLLLNKPAHSQAIDLMEQIHLIHLPVWYKCKMVKFSIAEMQWQANFKCIINKEQISKPNWNFCYVRIKVED